MLRQDHGPNRDFLTYLFCVSGLAMQFLNDVGLLRSKVQCNTCGQDMTCPQNPVFQKVLGGDVPERLLESSARRQGPLGPDPGSIRVGSPSVKIYLSLTASCAANLPTVSWKDIASVQVPSLIGACSAGKPCWFEWRAARKNSAVLTRSSKLTKASSVGKSTIGDTLLRVFRGVERESGITCPPCQLLLPATRDHTNGHLQVSLHATV